MKLDYLISYLLKERNETIGDLDRLSIDEKKRLYRGLVNIREPMDISDEYLKVEDEFLHDERRHKVTYGVNIKSVGEVYRKNNLVNDNIICIYKGDITKLYLEAIVNAGNFQGIGCFLPNHNCIDNQINTFAGVRLRLACDKIMKKLNYNLETGKAIITKGYNLPCEYVIETVGPIIENKVTKEKEEKLRDCYINSLKLALDNDIATIAFPCISTGVFRFPKDRACEIAIRTVDDFLSENKGNFKKVVFSLYSDEDVKYYEDEIRGY